MIKNITKSLQTQPSYLLDMGVLFYIIYSYKINYQKLNKSEKIKNDNFIKKVKERVDDKYDTSLVRYVKYGEPIELICPIHGLFIKNRIDRVKDGCPICKMKEINNKQRKPLKTLLDDFYKTHGNKYDYSLVEYINTYTPVIIICKKHGNFTQIPRDHIRGYECPLCNESKGERTINKYLNEHKIDFINQQIFDSCVSVKNNKLKFDFYLPKYNICIEYDGLQHYKPIKHWGGEDGLSKRMCNDEIKNKYCRDNNIKMIRIKYNDDIDNILKKLFENS